MYQYYDAANSRASTGNCVKRALAVVTGIDYQVMFQKERQVG